MWVLGENLECSCCFIRRDKSCSSCTVLQSNFTSKTNNVHYYCVYYQVQQNLLDLLF